MSARDAAFLRMFRLASTVVDRTLGPRLSILIFHRALREPDPLFPEELHASRFERLARTIAEAAHVMSLGEALALREQGRLPPRALVITFDDGYADNAEIALPILQRHGLRATFFVATGYLDGGRMFNDTVIECVRASRLDRADLSAWGLGDRSLVTLQDRRQVIDALLPLIKYGSLAERERHLAALHRQLGSPALPDSPMMRSDQVVQLHRAGMEIGAHTDLHPILRVTPDAEAEAEIAKGQRRLQNLLDAPVDVFAYPNGRPMRDYDTRHVDMVRRLGFLGAVSTAVGVAHAQADPFQLPRFTPWDEAPARWMARLLRSRLLGTRHEQAMTA